MVHAAYILIYVITNMLLLLCVLFLPAGCCAITVCFGNDRTSSEVEAAMEAGGRRKTAGLHFC